MIIFMNVIESQNPAPKIKKKLLKLFLKLFIAGIIFVGGGKLMGQVVLDNFDGFSPTQSALSALGGTPPVPQFVQNQGFITITPVNGGNPTDNGYFIKTQSVPLNLTGATNIALTARRETGDGPNTLIEIGLKDADGSQAYFYIQGSHFTTSAFTTVTTLINTNFAFETPFAFGRTQAGLDLSRIVEWSIGADGFGANPFRFSFDKLEVLGPVVSPASLTAATYAVITITGTVGTPYRVEYADALGNTNNWLTLTTIVLPSSPYLFIDTASSGASKRYYRAVNVP